MLRRIGLFSTLRPLERLGTPRVPVDRIVGVLQEVRAGLVREAIGHCEKRVGRQFDEHPGTSVADPGDTTRTIPRCHAPLRRRRPGHGPPAQRRGAGAWSDRSIPWWPSPSRALVLITAAFSVDAVRDAATLEPVGGSAAATVRRLSLHRADLQRAGHAHAADRWAAHRHHPLGHRRIWHLARAASASATGAAPHRSRARRHVSSSASC